MSTTIKIADTTAIYSDLVAAFVAGNRAGEEVVQAYLVPPGVTGAPWAASSISDCPA